MVGKQGRRFSTMPDRLGLDDWLTSLAVVQVAVASAVNIWQLVLNHLETRGAIGLVNAQHRRRIPGHKTDLSEGTRLAEWLGRGLLRARFIPFTPNRDLREVTR